MLSVLNRRLAVAVTFLVLLVGGAAVGQVPAVSVGDASALLGTSVSVTATFENEGDAVGYGPYLDVLLPAEGLSLEQARYLQDLDAVTINLDENGNAEHPFAVTVVDDEVQPVIVTGPENGTLTVLTLPFGSVTPGQPPMDVELDLLIGVDAVVDTAIDITVIPGFRYGSNPFDDPLEDEPLRGIPDDGQITPTIANFNKRLVAPEGDTNVGDSFTYSYVIDLELAPGQTFEDVVITDVLPNALVIRGGTLEVALNGVALSPSDDYVASFEVEAAGSHGGMNPNPPNFPGTTGEAIGPFASSSFEITLGEDLETPSGSPSVLSVSFDFYIPSVDATGLQAGDPASDNQERNEARYTATWTGNDGQPDGLELDGDDSVSTHITNEDVDHAEESNGTIRMQKWVGATGSKNQAVVPGEVVTFYLDFQVSDVSAFTDVVITDVLGDGLEYVEGSARIVRYDRRGAASVSGDFAAGNVQVSGPDTSGATTLTLDVSDQLKALQQGLEVLLGACVQDGFGGLEAACLAGGTAPTVGQISYQARVLNEYRETKGSGSDHVVQNDHIDNEATIRGKIVNVVTGVETELYDSDPGAASVTVGGTSTSKRIAFINDDAVQSDLPQVSAGELVTFELEVNLSSIAFRDLQVTDFLPLPVFEVPADMTFTGECDVGEPTSAGEVCYGTGSTFQGAVTNAASSESYDLNNRPVTIDATANSFTVDFGSFAPTSGEAGPATIRLWATLEVADTALADGLYVTNMVEARDFNSPGVRSTQQELVQLQYTRPVLNITNGVIDVDGNSAFDTSGYLGPISAPHGIVSGDDPYERWDEIYDLDAHGLDARDVVTYIVIVENSGRGKNGAYDIRLREHLPPGLVYEDVVEGSLRAYLGTGDEISVPGGTTAGQAALFDGSGLLFPGLMLARGVQENGQPTGDGSNVLYLTYQVRLPETSESGASYRIDSEVVGYTAEAHGVQMTNPGLITDDVTVSVSAPSLAKSIVATSEGHTAAQGGVEQVAIGEIVRYRLTLDVAEGRTTALVLTDPLPSGLQYLEGSSGVRIAAVSQDDGHVSLQLGGDDSLTPPRSSTAPTVLNDSNSARLPGDQVGFSENMLTFDLGDVQNDADDLAVEQLLLEFNALVQNSTANDGTAGNNSAQRLKTNVATAAHRAAPNRTSVTSNSVQVQVFEPRLTLTKSAGPSSGADAGDAVEFTITLTNGPASQAVTAFDVTVTDKLPVHVNYVSHDPLDISGTVEGAEVTESGGLLTITADSMAPGSSISLTVNTTLAGTLPAGGVISNTASYEASSLPGANGTVDNPTGDETPGASGTPAGERTYTGDATATVEVATPEPGKSVVGTSAAHTEGTDVAIGEVVRYRVAVSVPEGVSEDFTILDDLPDYVALHGAGDVRVAFIGGGFDLPGDLGGAHTLTTCDLAAVPAPMFPLPASRVTATSEPGGSQSALSFGLGTITNTTTDDSVSCVVIEYDVLVLDHAANVRGRILENSVQVIANSNPGPSDTATVRVVEPSLTISKSVDAETAADGADAGDTVTYALQVGHTSASNADAFGIVITDDLPAQIDPGSVVVTPNELVTSNAGGSLVLSVPELAVGDVVSITVSGQLVSDLPPASAISNTATVSEYHSLPPTDPNAREYPSVSDTVGFTTRDLAITKAVQATSEEHTSGTDVVVGEVVRYHLSVLLPEGLTADLAITDSLPAGLTPLADAGVRAAVVAQNANTTPVSAASLPDVPVHAAAPPVLNGDNSLLLSGGVASFAGNDLTVSLGDVTNAQDVDGDETLLLEFNALVTNAASNVDGATLRNTVVLTTDGRSLPAAFADVTVREPELSITKVVLGGSTAYSNVEGGGATLTNADIGEEVTYRVTLTNAAGAVSAHGVNVADAVPAGLELRRVEVQRPGAALEVIDPATGQVDVDLSTLEPGQSLIVEYTVEIAEGLPALASISNTAEFTAGTVQDPADNNHNVTGSPSGAPRTYGSSDTATVTLGEPVVGLAKALVADPVTTDGGVYTFQYRFTVANLGALPLVGVQVTDDLLATFPAASGVTVTAATVSSVTVNSTDATGAANPDFNQEDSGAVDTNLLVPGALDLDVGEEAIILLDLSVTLEDEEALGTYHNTAFANGGTPGGIPAEEDPSSDGDDPTGPEMPTPVTFTESTGLTLTKEFLEDQLVSHGDGSYTVAYRIGLTNDGIVPLRSLQVTDDLAGLFGPDAVIHAAAAVVDDSPSTLVLNGAYDGVNDTDILDAATSELAAGATQSLTLTVTATPSHTNESYTNTAYGTGVTPLGQTPNGDDSASNTFTAAPEITLGTCVASVVPQTAGPTGTYTVILTVRMENTGDLQLAQSQATLNLADIFADADSYDLESITQSGGATVPANSDYGTAGVWSLLPAGTTLHTELQAADPSLPSFAQYDVAVTVVPGNELVYEVNAAAEGQAPVFAPSSSGLVTAAATDWCDPSEAPGPGPSVVDFDDEPQIGVAKRFVQLAAVEGQPGVFDVTFEFALRNYGNAQLNDVALHDDFDVTFQDGSAWEITSIEATGTLNAATPADANSDGNLLAAGSILGSQGQATDKGTVTLTVRVTPMDPSATYENSAAAEGTSPDGTRVQDDSVDGEEPDADGDGDPTNDESPTPFTFETPIVGLAKGVPTEFDFGLALGTDSEAGPVTNPHNLDNMG